MTMRTSSLMILLALILGAAPMRAQTPSWSSAWSFPMRGTEQPIGAGLDAAGNIYVASYARDFTAADPDDMITQMLISSSPEGVRRWSRAFLAGTSSRGGAMDVDAAGNVYVAASFTGRRGIIDRGERLDTIDVPEGASMLVAKYDAAGKLLWHLIVPGSDSIQATGVIATPEGIWLGGTFTRTVDFGETHLTSAGGSDAFIAMLDTDGVFHRAMRAGGSSTDECSQIAVDRNGEVVMLGEFRGTASFGGQTVTATGGANFVLVRYRADGTADWVSADGGPSFTPAYTFTPTPLRMTMDDNGNIYVAISYLDTIVVGGNPIGSIAESDAIVIKYQPDGTWDWVSWFPGEFAQTMEGLAPDSDGSVYVSGFSQDLPVGTLFLTRISPAGNRLWELYDRPNPSGGAAGGPICIDARHTIVVAGHFGGRTRLGDYPLASEGSSESGSIAGEDIFIARVGATSGVATPHDRDGARAPFTITQRDHRIMLIPTADAPVVADAGLYSILGDRVASPVEPPATGNAISFDLDGLARGAYMIMVRTTRGLLSYRVVAGE